jgi:hypothetical protein
MIPKKQAEAWYIQRILTTRLVSTNTAQKKNEGDTQTRHFKNEENTGTP